MLRQGSEQTEPAGFSGSGREGRMVQTSCVCHCDFKIISPTPLAIPRLFHPFELSTGGGSPAWIFGLELGFIFDLEKCFSSSFPPRLASTISFHFRRIYISSRCLCFKGGSRFKNIYIYIHFSILWFVTFSIPGQGHGCSTRRRVPAAGINIQLYSQENRESPCCVARVTSTPATRSKRGKFFKIFTSREGNAREARGCASPSRF